MVRRRAFEEIEPKAMWEKRAVSNHEAESRASSFETLG
jgi:hypothetical protein